MERFNSIYPFTTENIAGYMESLNLTSKRVFTVTGSSDHILNAVCQGSLDITTFDINPKAKYYMDLKIAGIKQLSFEEFLCFFLEIGRGTFQYDTFCSFDMEEDSKQFFEQQYQKFSYQGNQIRESSIFHNSYFNMESKKQQNLYLEEKSYYELQEKLNHTKIQFLSTNLTDLTLTEDYDYMFLSNISDYLNLLYSTSPLECYQEKLFQFLERIPIIYFAYLYDIGNSHPRSSIDCLEHVFQVFGDAQIETFPSALEGVGENQKDGVLILKKGGINHVRK